jgi:hypothetical protein
MNAKVNSIRMLAMSGLSVMMLAKANAVIPEKVKLTLLPNKMVIIEANIPQAQSANLEIINLGTREIVYDDHLAAPDVHKTVYNLQALPEGKYSLVIEHGNITHEKEILLTEGKTYLIKETSYTAPVFETTGDGKLLVRYLNHSGENVSVSFFRNSENFFSDEIGIPTSFERSYNLKNLESGNYSVVLKTGNKSFYYDLNKI